MTLTLTLTVTLTLTLTVWLRVTVAASPDLSLTLTLALTRCLHKMLETLANDMPAQQRHSRCRGASRQRHSADSATALTAPQRSLRWLGLGPPWAGAPGACLRHAHGTGRGVTEPRRAQFEAAVRRPEAPVRP